jgi:biotin synthase
MEFDELHALYHQSLFDLISQSRAVHLDHWRGEEIQRCSLLTSRRAGVAVALLHQ